MMKIGEIRELTKEELETRLAEAKKNIFSLRFQKSSGQLENVMKIKNLKKDIAKIETLIREKELGIYEKREIKKSKQP